MSTRFYSGQKDYIPQLNAMDQAFQDAMTYISGSNAIPTTLGTAAAGTSTLFARGDHVHPSTGTTQSFGNNTTQYATTAFVHAALGNMLYKSVVGGVTLTAAEALYAAITMTGTLTANVNVIVPNSSRMWLFSNSTTGAFTVTVKTAAGGGIAIKQGQNRYLYCDGSNVLATDTDMSGISLDGMTSGTINGNVTVANGGGPSSLTVGTGAVAGPHFVAVIGGGANVDYGYKLNGNFGMWTNTADGSVVRFGNGAERMRLTGSNLLIGTTTDNGTDKVQVAGTVNATGVIASGTSFNAPAFYVTNSLSLGANNTITMPNNGPLSIVRTGAYSNIVLTDTAGAAFGRWAGAANMPHLWQNGNGGTTYGGISTSGNFIIGAGVDDGSGNKLQVVGGVKVNSLESTGGVTVSNSNGAIELGNQTAANTPYIDFHSGATGTDFDARILATGGNGTNGKGDLQISASNVTMSGTLSTTGNMTVGGNLIVNGTTTTVNSTTVTVDDVVLTLGGDTAPTSNDGKDRGIEFRYHNGTAAKLGYFGWDNSLGKYVFMHDATNASEVFSGTKSTIVANLEGTVTGNVTGNLTGDVTGNLTGAQTNTNLGRTGNLGFAAPNTAAAWASLPVGFASMIDYNVTTAGGLPENQYGYFFKLANRDAFSGWGGIWLGYGANDTYVGGTADGSQLPTWYKVFTSRTTVPVGNGGTGQTSYAIGDILYANTTSTLAKLADIATGNVLLSGGVGVAPSYGKVGLTTHVSGTLPIANGGTNSTATPTTGGVAYGDGSKIVYSAAGTSGQFLKSNGTSAPTYATLDLNDLPGAWAKKSVRAASVANIATLSGTATIDGVALVANDRILVKNQTTASQNGIYIIASGAWTRATDADSSNEVASAVVCVDEGTTQGGDTWTTSFKPTDTIGTTSMVWSRVIDSGNYTNYTVSTPSGLSVDKSTTDLNVLTTVGFYRGNNLTNAPDTGFWFVAVEAHGGTYAKQTVTAYGAGAVGGTNRPIYIHGTTFLRVLNNGVWGSWQSIGGGATGGGSDKVFQENDTTVTSNYTITAGKNAMSAGPITIASGVTVTIPTGSVWTIV